MAIVPILVRQLLVGHLKGMMVPRVVRDLIPLVKVGQRIRQAGAQVYIERMLRAKMAPTAIVNRLLGRGQAYRRARMFSDIAAWRSRIDKSLAAERTPRARRIPAGAHVPTPTRLTEKYIYHVKVRVRDTVTGRFAPSQWISVRSSHALSQAELTGSAQGTFRTKDYRGPKEHRLAFDKMTAFEPFIRED